MSVRLGDLFSSLPNSENLISAADLPDTNEFVTSLASLSSFTDLESTPVLMGELSAPSGLTDELPPLGGLPNQLPGLMGVAPITPDTGAIGVMSAPTLSSSQAVESLDVTTTREVVTPLAAVQPHEELRPLDLERPVVAPIEPLAPNVPVLANFVSPPSVVESDRDDLGTSVPVEPSTVSDFSEPGVPSLALNNFTDALPLINLPGEASEIEVPSITTGLARDVAPSLDLPVTPRDFDLPLTRSERSSAMESSVDGVVSAVAPVTPSAPLSISRYAEDLPLPAPVGGK